MSRSATQQSNLPMDQGKGRTRFAVKETSLCKFPFSDGRRCRMLRHPAHPSLCAFHARAELQLRESATLGTELSTTISGGFMTATDVNHVLGKLYTAVAQDRVPARNAATLAYLGQLLLNSVSGIKSEYKFCYTFDQWRNMTLNAEPLSPPSPLAGETPSAGVDLDACEQTSVPVPDPDQPAKPGEPK